MFVHHKKIPWTETSWSAAIVRKEQAPQISSTARTFIYLRIGQFYPNLTDAFSYDQCSTFWRENKVKIKLVNMGEDGYMENIQASAYVAIAFDVLVGICIFVTVWRQTNMQKIFNDSKDEYGPWTFGYYLIKVGPFKCFSGFGSKIGP